LEKQIFACARLQANCGIIVTSTVDRGHLIYFRRNGHTCLWIRRLDEPKTLSGHTSENIKICCPYEETNHDSRVIQSVAKSLRLVRFLGPLIKVLEGEVHTLTCLEGKEDK